MQKKYQFILAIVVTICLGGAVFASTVLSQNYQRSHVVLWASEVLPKSLLKGPNYRVQEVVINDGMINTYELDTNYGPLKVESTALLLKRINELNATSKIEELKGTDVYLQALKQAGTAPLRTAGGGQSSIP